MKEREREQQEGAVVGAGGAVRDNLDGVLPFALAGKPGSEVSEGTWGYFCVHRGGTGVVQ